MTGIWRRNVEGQWDSLEQVYTEIKGCLRLRIWSAGERDGIKNADYCGSRMLRGHGWRISGMRCDEGAEVGECRHLMFREHHPVEKVMRCGVGPLTVEGIPRERYRLLDEREARN